MTGKCELCGIECELSKHHLIPKLKAKNKYKDIKDDPSNWLWICRSCHDHIHATFSENELRDQYFSKELLLTCPEILKFINWKIKHPKFTGHAKMGNKRKY